MRFAFAVGALLALAAAVTGILIYTSNPSSNFYLIGWDELEHRSFAEALLHGNSGSLFENALQGQALTGSANWGTGLIIALSRYLFGSELAFIALKWALHVLAAWLLYGLLQRYRGANIASWATLFFLLYPPLLLYEASFLKDDLVASLVVIAAAAIDRRRFVAAAALLLMMIAIRANAVMFPIILMGYLRRARLRYVLLAAAIPFAAVALVLPGSVERMADIVLVSPGTVGFFAAKYLLGPVPTNLFSYQTESAWLFPWYTLSFLGIFMGFLSPGFYASLRANWIWILLLLTASLAPYLPYVNEVDIIGPRQFATVGWLYFMLFYERALRHGLRFEPPQPAEDTWSPAT